MGFALHDVATACVSVSDVQDRRVRTAGSRGTTAWGNRAWGAHLHTHT